MERQYYDLIITLIKQHKKYPGYESILDEIANDVYKHAEVVLGSITNEDVVVAYLNKVISTSLVTVPKKLDVNIKTRKCILPSMIISSQTQESLNKIEEEKVETCEDTEALAETELGIIEQESFEIEPPCQETESETVEEFEEKLSEEEEEEIPLEEAIEEQVILNDETETVNDSSIIEDTEAVLDDNINFEEEEVENAEDELVEELETLASTEDVNSDSEIIETPLNHAEDVDKNLVDMMINGVPTIEESSEEVIEEEIVDFENNNLDELEDLSIEEHEEEITEIYETLEEVEPVIEKEDSRDESNVEASDFEIEDLELPGEETNMELEDEIILDEEFEATETLEENLVVEDNFATEDNNEDLSLDEFVESSEYIEAESIDTIEEVVLEEFTEETGTSINVIENELEDNDVTNIEPEEVPLEIDSSESTLELDAELGLSELDTEDELSIEEAEEEIPSELIMETDSSDELEQFSIEDDSELNEIIEENDDSGFSIPCYDCFAYEPENCNYDGNEIMSYLNDIDQKHPERKILDICEMKYKQNLSVAEIVEKTGFTEELVINVLTEIIDTVKD